MALEHLPDIYQTAHKPLAQLAEIQQGVIKVLLIGIQFAPLELLLKRLHYPRGFFHFFAPTDRFVPTSGF